MRLKGKVSIITGGGRGIGQATALKFAKRRRHGRGLRHRQASVDEAVGAIRAEAGGDAMGFIVDVTKRATIDEMVAGDHGEARPRSTCWSTTRASSWMPS